jgi:8-oxo-dGTP pyrophosphatase MutT (NUDIX family)
MLEFEILARGLYRPEQLHITYQPTQILPFSVEQQVEVDHFWQAKLLQAKEQQRLLFDAPLYRLINARQATKLTINLILGDTSYKEYVITREQTFAQDRPRIELSNPLAVCSVIETSDGMILLDQRQGLDVYNGRYHVIGGFFERSIDVTAQQPDPFQAIQREIREETGILATDICEQYCLGLVYDLTMPHSELCFLTRLRIPLAEVQQRKSADNEIKALQTLSVTEKSLSQFIQQQHGNISATGEPNLLFYGAWKFGEPWLEELLQRL